MYLVAGADNMVIVWDAGTGEALSSVELPDIPLCASFNWDGSRVVTSCKDKKIRILDPRSGTILTVSIKCRCFTQAVSGRTALCDLIIMFCGIIFAPTQIGNLTS